MARAGGEERGREINREEVVEQERERVRKRISSSGWMLENAAVQ